MRTRKQVAEILNNVNNRNDIEVKNDGGYWFVRIGGYESNGCYSLKDLVAEIVNKETIKLTYNRWTMQGMKVTTIKGLN